MTWLLHGVCFGEEAGTRNLVFFPCKVAAAGDAAAVVQGDEPVSPLCSAT